MDLVHRKRYHNEVNKYIRLLESLHEYWDLQVDVWFFHISNWMFLSHLSSYFDTHPFFQSIDLLLVQVYRFIIFIFVFKLRMTAPQSSNDFETTNNNKNTKLQTNPLQNTCLHQKE